MTKTHNPSRTERFIYSVTLGYIHHALVLVVGFVATPIIMKRVGGERYGLWLMASQFLAYLTLFDFGVGFLYPREISKLSARTLTTNSAYRYGSVVSHFASMSLFQIPMILVGCAVIWVFLPTAWKYHWDLCAILFGTYVLSYAFRFFFHLVTGMQDQKWLSVLQLVGWAASTAVTLIWVYYDQSMLSLVVGWSVGELIVPIVCCYRVYRRYPYLLQKVRVRFDRLPFKKYFLKSRWMTFSQLSQLLVGSTDLILVGKLASTTQVTQYAMTGKLFNMGIHLPDRIAHVATPSMFQVVVSHKRDYTSKVIAAVTHVIVVASGLIGAGILATNREFITFWVGGDWYGGNTLTLAFAVNMVVYHLAACLTFGCLWLGEERVGVLATFFTGLVNLALAIPMTKYWNTLGPLWAGTVARIIVCVPWTTITLARYLRLHRREVLTVQLPVLKRILMMFVFSFSLSYVPSFSNLSGVLIKGTFVLVLYLWVMKPVLLGELLGPYIRPLLADLKLTKWVPKRFRRKKVSPDEDWLQTKKAG